MENNELVLEGSPPLPEEIILYDIFARLPVKSLYRFRCVSKFCRSLTSQPPFLDAFRSRSRGRYVLSFTCASRRPFIFYYSTHEGLEKYQGRIIYRDHTGIHMHDSYRNHTYVKFINGFTFLARERQVVVRNFVTNEEFHLPPFYDYRSHGELHSHSVYFCDDPATGKYKVLMPTRVENIKLEVISMRFSIFTLGEDKSWRNFHQTGLYLMNYQNSKSACVNGVLFCTNFSTGSRKFQNEDWVIAAFDVGRECFDILRYPDGLSPKRYSLCDLTNFKGSIAIVDVQNLESCIMRLWIKAGGLGSESWVEHRIQFPLPLENVSFASCQFSFTTNRDGEIVVGLAKMLSPRCWIFCHNLETGRWRRIDIPLIKGHAIYSDFLIHEYVETPSLLREVLKS